MTNEHKYLYTLNLGLGGRTANKFELFCSGMYKQSWNYFRCIIGLSKLVNEMMLRARILTVEKNNTHMYGIERGKKELCEYD